MARLKEVISGSEFWNCPGRVQLRCKWLGTVTYHFSVYEGKELLPREWLGVFSFLMNFAND